ncbi:MAG TPA: STAS/SEC14 domain-containing protein, partial [Oceanospirillales bacterium]|nr:STAS/SEC14 domain-containing protein [Oceanospirillales bacterium]
NEFNKIALYGNRDWQKLGAKVGTWFISGEIKYFDNLPDAAAWLKTKD